MSYQIIDVTNCKKNGLSEYSQEVQNAYKTFNKPSNYLTRREDRDNKLWLILDNDNFVGFISSRITQPLPITKNVMYIIDVSDVAMFELAAPLLEEYIANNYDTTKIITDSLPGSILEKYGYTCSKDGTYSKPVNYSNKTA